MLFDSLIDNKSIPMMPFVWKLLDWIYPPFCCNCNRIGYEICPQCFGQIELLHLKNTCSHCGKTIEKGLICSDCMNHPPVYDQLKSWAVYEGVAREIITNIKFQRRIGLIPYLIPALAKTLAQWNVSVDAAVPVPLGKARKHARGFNQSDLIAKPLAKQLKLPYQPGILERIKETRSQVGLSAADRRQNMKGAFKANRAYCCQKSILLVDDIATTGATLNACAAALKDAGAARVFCFTIARTNSVQNFNQIEMEVSI